MKGLEISNNMIVIIVLAVIVLISIGYFLTSQSGSQQQLANANEVFSISCQQYKDNNCAWSNTHLPNFANFVAACQTLFGAENREFSCLYNFCCSQSREAKCDGFCALCKGNDYSGIGADSVDSCLARYRAECSAPCSI